MHPEAHRTCASKLPHPMPKRTMQPPPKACGERIVLPRGPHLHPAERPDLARYSARDCRLHRGKTEPRYLQQHHAAPPLHSRQFASNPSACRGSPLLVPVPGGRRGLPASLDLPRTLREPRTPPQTCVAIDPAAPSKILRGRRLELSTVQHAPSTRASPAARGASGRPAAGRSPGGT